MGGASGRDGLSLEVYGLWSSGYAAEKAGGKKPAGDPGPGSQGIRILAPSAVAGRQHLPFARVCIPPGGLFVS